MTQASDRDSAWPPDVGATLDKRYSLDELLGRGPRGAVFEAFDMRLGEDVVIKCLDARYFSGERGSANLLRLHRGRAFIHPNVVRVRDVVTESGRPYVVTDPVPGEDLASRLARLGPMTPGDALGILGPVASALAWIGQLGPHGNLKASNVFVAGDAVKVVDPWYIEDPEDDGASQGWSAPEQRLGAWQATPATDVYGFALLAGFLLAGREVWPSVALSAGGVANVTPELDRVFERATSPDPTARPRDVAALWAELEPALAAAVAPGAGAGVAPLELSEDEIDFLEEEEITGEVAIEELAEVLDEAEEIEPVAEEVTLDDADLLSVEVEVGEHELIEVEEAAEAEGLDEPEEIVDIVEVDSEPGDVEEVVEVEAVVPTLELGGDDAELIEIEGVESAPGPGEGLPVPEPLFADELEEVEEVEAIVIDEEPAEAAMAAEEVESEATVALDISSFPDLFEDRDGAAAAAETEEPELGIPGLDAEGPEAAGPEPAAEELTLDEVVEVDGHEEPELLIPEAGSDEAPTAEEADIEEPAAEGDEGAAEAGGEVAEPTGLSDEEADEETDLGAPEDEDFADEPGFGSSEGEATVLDTPRFDEDEEPREEMISEAAAEEPEADQATHTEEESEVGPRLDVLDTVDDLPAAAMLLGDDDEELGFGSREEVAELDLPESLSLGEGGAVDEEPAEDEEALGTDEAPADEGLPEVVVEVTGGEISTAAARSEDTEVPEDATETVVDTEEPDTVVDLAALDPFATTEDPGEVDEAFDLATLGGDEPAAAVEPGGEAAAEEPGGEAEAEAFETAVDTEEPDFEEEGPEEETPEPPPDEEEEASAAAADDEAAEPDISVFDDIEPQLVTVPSMEPGKLSEAMTPGRSADPLADAPVGEPAKIEPLTPEGLAGEELDEDSPLALAAGMGEGEPDWGDEEEPEDYTPPPPPEEEEPEEEETPAPPPEEPRAYEEEEPAAAPKTSRKGLYASLGVLVLLGAGVGIYAIARSDEKPAAPAATAPASGGGEPAAAASDATTTVSEVAIHAVADDAVDADTAAAFAIATDAADAADAAAGTLVGEVVVAGADAGDAEPADAGPAPATDAKAIDAPLISEVTLLPADAEEGEPADADATGPDAAAEPSPDAGAAADTAAPAEEPDVDEAEEPATSCPDGMSEITRRGSNWTERKANPDGIKYCMDSFEYPGAGAAPAVDVSEEQAEQACTAQGKRLCTSTEMSAACGRWYPYGNKMDASACHTGRKEALAPSGSYEKCVSEFGVYDIIGNAAELTADGKTFGGNAYQGHSMSGCTKVEPYGGPSKTVGFRCCKDLAAPAP